MIRDLPLDQNHVVTIEKVKNNRTAQQNRALHLYFTMLANALNDAGLDQRQVLKPEIDMPWSQYSVKEFLWRPIQKAMTQKDSTAKLERQEINDIFRVLHLHMVEKLSVNVFFPDHHLLEAEKQNNNLIEYDNAAQSN